MTVKRLAATGAADIPRQTESTAVVANTGIDVTLTQFVTPLPMTEVTERSVPEWQTVQSNNSFVSPERFPVLV